jgi:hypothetical protein
LSFLESSIIQYCQSATNGGGLQITSASTYPLLFRNLEWWGLRSLCIFGVPLSNPNFIHIQDESYNQARMIFYGHLFSNEGASQPNSKLYSSSSSSLFTL